MCSGEKIAAAVTIARTGLSLPAVALDPCPPSSRFFVSVVPSPPKNKDYGSAPDVEIEALSPLGFALGKKAAVRRVTAREHDLACLRSSATCVQAYIFLFFLFLSSVSSINHHCFISAGLRS